MAGNVASTKEIRNVHYILTEKPEGKKLHGRPRCRWEDIKMDKGNRVLRSGLDSSGS
jgi:hypothetical protein